MNLRIQISREFLAVCRSKHDLKKLAEAIRKIPKKSEFTDRDCDSMDVGSLSARIQGRN